MHDLEVDSTTVEAIIVASRTLVAIAARSLVGVDSEVTLGQYRALVFVATRRQVNLVDLANDLRVHPASATRMCDRLVEKGLIERNGNPGDRRQHIISLSKAGSELVAKVTQIRRDEVNRIISRMPADICDMLTRSLRAFSEAADESIDGERFVLWPF